VRLVVAQVGIRFAGKLPKGRYRLGPPLGAGGRERTLLARDEPGRTFSGPDARVGELVVVATELRVAGLSSWKKPDLFEREARTLRARSSRRAQARRSLRVGGRAQRVLN
jgi:hypothetical protein